jgi:hypothetical protein
VGEEEVVVEEEEGEVEAVEEAEAGDGNGKTCTLSHFTLSRLFSCIYTHTLHRPRDGQDGHYGHGGGGGGGGGGEGGAAGGYFKPSFLEDPWLPLLTDEERRQGPSSLSSSSHSHYQRAQGSVVPESLREEKERPGEEEEGKALKKPVETVTDDAEIDIDDL